jgi:hypothetical protein
MRSLRLLLFALIAPAFAQPTQDFPGSVIQMQFTERGYIYANAPGGRQDSGDWRVEDGRLCGTLRSVGAFCNEARMSGGFLHVRRTNGEVIRYEPE